eukprot:Em0021g548a
MNTLNMAPMKPKHHCGGGDVGYGGGVQASQDDSGHDNDYDGADYNDVDDDVDGDVDDDGGDDVDDGDDDDNSDDNDCSTHGSCGGAKMITVIVLWKILLMAPLVLVIVGVVNILLQEMPSWKVKDKILWPVLVTTMSLPPKIRMDAENVMVAALWLGSCKPPMDILLRSTLSIIEDLTKGIEFTTPQGRIQD